MTIFSLVLWCHPHLERKVSTSAEVRDILIFYQGADLRLHSDLCLTLVLIPTVWSVHADSEIK